MILTNAQLSLLIVGLGLVTPCNAQFVFTNVGHASNVFGADSRSVAISSNYAYLANGQDGLRTYNVTNPANPIAVGHVYDGGAALRVVVSGQYLYLANGGDGLRIYDLSNPANPVSIGHTNDSAMLTQFAWSVAVSGDFAYLANSRDGLRIYNISNRSNPMGVGHFDNHSIAQSFTPYANGVAVSGNYAYLANGSDGLRVFDVSDPSNPLTVSRSTNAGNALAVALSGQYAYLANNNDGVRVYDISNPSNLVNVGHAPGAYPQSFSISGANMFSANDNGGLHVYDISDPPNIVDVGSANTLQYPGGIANGVAFSEGYAYIANYQDGLRVFQAIPLLSIRRKNTDSLIVYWPWADLNLNLRENNTLDGINWIPAQVPPAIINGKTTWVVPTTNSTHYFRLQF